jgi:hypothetical protein
MTREMRNIDRSRRHDGKSHPAALKPTNQQNRPSERLIEKGIYRN